ncbi:unnamed protein product [Litomosoides sigmodontis]|uniref:SLC26A/SulP transporter domain-containing protein n=1 Tax=Litomosoides sigmodontis TaxID=42156 RepID=A0A3P6TN93_LITSI|nr:unnamed protein product [Litomosoides sigmodontis]
MGTEAIWSTYGLNQEEYDRKFQYRSKSTIKDRLKKGTRRLLTPCSSPRNLWRFFTNFVPILQWLPKYNWKADIPHDVIGGLTIGVMHVPQGIAYAVLAGVDPVYGLYVSLFPVFFYMLFGTSKHASVGSFSVTAIMCALASDEVMLQHTGMSDDNTVITGSNDTVPSITYVEITTTLAFTTGIIELVAGVLQLEFITAYFSDQLVSGFITGSSVHVAVAQIDDFFGINSPKFHGIGYLFKIIISIIVSHTMNLNTHHNVPIVGEIPTALPKPRLPRFDVIVDCFPYAIGITAVTVAVHISMAKMLAKRLKYHVDPNQELYALGFTTVLSSFFPIFPLCTALARTMVSVEVGIRSQLSAVSSCLLLLAVILMLGPVLNALPMCILAVIIVMSLRSMLEKFAELPKIWPVSKIDFLIWIVAFVTTVALDVMIGLIISVLFALMTLIFRSQWPRWERLVQLSESQPYFDNPKRYIAAGTNSNIRLYRFQSPLLFNNVERFKTNIYNAITDWKKSAPSVVGVLSDIF